MGPRAEAEQTADYGKRRRCGWKCKTAIASVLVAVAGLIAVQWVVHHAEPMLKARVVRTLEARFESHVELAGFQVSVLNGLDVNGTGLKIFPRGVSSTTPLFSVDRFSFHTRWLDLFRSPMRVRVVHIHDFSLNLPPKGQRWKMPKLKGKKKKQAASIVVDKLDVSRATLTLEPGKPGKIPLVFNIEKLDMQRVGPDQPMKFQAVLVNPKPVGQIRTKGTFGPFDEGDAGETPVRGQYHFDKVDLGTIKGIGGELSSTGRFSGKLNRIEVDGETKTPNFQIASVGHPEPLDTTFHAIVDGTNGNTYLQPVRATLGSSHIVARGDVVRGKDGHGHAIHLNVVVDQAQIEDFLRVAVKAEPPLMTGAVKMHVKFDLPPGKVAVLDKLHLRGDFAIRDAKFSSKKIQTEVDRLSLRAQGRPKDAEALHQQQKQGHTANSPKIASQIDGQFMLGGAQLRLPHLEYRLPGAVIAMEGTYSLNHRTLNFHGQVRTQAKASQMTTGWKSFALKAVDPFLKKPGAGMQVPIKVTGQQSKPKIGLDFKHRHRDHRVAQPRP
jgi:hypothetical protein